MNPPFFKIGRRQMVASSTVRFSRSHSQSRDMAQVVAGRKPASATAIRVAADVMVGH